MGINEIEKEIRKSGHEEIKKITKDAEEEARKIREESEKEAKRRYQRIKEERKHEVELVHRRIISDSRMERNTRLDAKRSEIVQRVFDSARAKILNMGDNEKRKLLRRLVDEGKRHVEEPVVYVDREYAHLLNGVQVKKLDDFGALIESAEGKMRIDNTLGSIIKRRGPSLKPKITKILFRENVPDS